MIETLVQKPEIATALIAAIVSLIIAGIGGIFTFIKFNRKIENLRSEISAQIFTEHYSKEFIQMHEKYLSEYKPYENKLRILIKLEDGTQALQHLINFYSENSRPIIQRFPDFIGKDIVELSAKLQCTIDGIGEVLAPNDPYGRGKILGDQLLELNRRIFEVRAR